MIITRTGTLSGCVVWLIVFGFLSSCFLPAAMIVGGLTSVTDFAMQTIGPLICPEGTAARSYSYATTTTDEFGNSHPSTAFELHCVDTNDEIVKKDPVLYAFLWIGIIAAVGLGAAVLLAFALAAPAGILIARLLDRNKKGVRTSTIEPE